MSTGPGIRNEDSKANRSSEPQVAGETGREPLIEILSVSVPPGVPDQLLGSNIEEPKTGDTEQLFVLHIVGWALGRHSKAIAVEVVYQGRVVRIAPIRGRRKDLEQAFPTISEGTDAEFHAMVGMPGLTAEFELELVAVLEDGSRAPIGSVRARHRSVRPSFEPRLQPILLTCLGRSGSTRLMEILDRHPRVVLYRRFPYESMSARYWAHMLKVLAEPANLTQSSRPGDFSDDLWHIGHNPYYDDGVAYEGALGEWFGRTYVQRLADFCVSNTDDWYVALAQEQEKKEPLYFAEKHMWPDHTQVLMRELYPDAKEVFLVRDFRDLVCSILAFDDKRGFFGFRRPPGKTDEQYAREDLGAMAVSLYESWRSRGDSSHLVRYEDMVLRPGETMKGLFDYLQLDPPAGAGAEVREGSSTEAATSAEHRTSSDARTSIGRWQREADESLKALFEEVFTDLLVDFGYSKQ
jgi:hypothetical protein